MPSYNFTADATNVTPHTVILNGIYYAYGTMTQVLKWIPINGKDPSITWIDADGNEYTDGNYCMSFYLNFLIPMTITRLDGSRGTLLNGSWSDTDFQTFLSSSGRFLNHGTGYTIQMIEANDFITMADWQYTNTDVDYYDGYLPYDGSTDYTEWNPYLNPNIFFTPNGYDYMTYNQSTGQLAGSSPCTHSITLPTFTPSQVVKLPKLFTPVHYVSVARNYPTRWFTYSVGLELMD